MAWRLYGIIFKASFQLKWSYDFMFYKIIYFYVNLGKEELIHGNIGGIYVTKAFKLVESNKRSFHLKLCDDLWIDLIMSLSLLMGKSVQLSKCNIAVSFCVSPSKTVNDWVDFEVIQKLVPPSLNLYL